MFKEGKEGAHDLCGAITRTIEGGSHSKNWVRIWTPLLAKVDFNDQETQRLTLGIRLVKTPPEVHGGWYRNQLQSNTITDAWTGARTKDTVMVDRDMAKEDEDLVCFQEKGSILKASKHTKKTDSAASQGYFKPRSNLKPKNKRGIFRKIAFKTYLQLSLPIAIQQVTEYRATETRTLEALTEIWKTLTSVNIHNVNTVLALGYGRHTETTYVYGL